MKGTFQLIKGENGARSPAMVCDTDEFAKLLRKGEVPHEDYVLLIAIEEAEEFSTAPLISVGTYLQIHDIEYAEEETANG